MIPATARFRCLSCAAVALLLGACATQSPRPAEGTPERAYDDRATALDAWSAWTLTARLGISAGDDGGSGRLDWLHERERAELRFRGTLGQGAWRLESTPDTARLELANGDVREAREVETLVGEATGWSVPVTALAWWVRGLAWPDGDPDYRLTLNDDGTPASLDQAGWNVAFKRYSAGPDDLLMPTRLEAEKDGLVVKLAISRWGRERVEGAATGAGDG